MNLNNYTKRRLVQVFYLVHMFADSFTTYILFPQAFALLYYKILLSVSDKICLNEIKQNQTAIQI